MEYNYDNEQEWFFNFRGMSLGVMDETLEGAMSHLASTYRDVTQEELDDAYERGNK